MKRSFQNLNKFIRDMPQCDHFQQFYNRYNVKVHVPIIRWSQCACNYKMFFKKS